VNRALFVCVLLPVGAIAPLAGCAKPPTDHSRILFGNSESRLSGDEMAAVFATFGEFLTISDDSLRLDDSNCGDIMPEVEVVDLNRDGTQEVFVLWGNSCTSGMAGRSLTLLIRGPSGDYERNFGFPAAGWAAQAPGEDGWPDLIIDGPSFCHPIWTFRAGRYEFKCNRPATAGGCAMRGDLCLDA